MVLLTQVILYGCGWGSALRPIFSTSVLEIILTLTSSINYQFVTLALMCDVCLEHARPTPILIPRCSVETNDTQLNARKPNFLVSITSTPYWLIDLLELIVIQTSSLNEKVSRRTLCDNVTITVTPITLRALGTLRR